MRIERDDEPAPARAAQRSLHYWMPNRLDLYVLREVVAPFLAGIVFIIFLFLMFQALRLADLLIVHGVPAALLGRMTMLLSLNFMPMVLPVAFLIAVLVSFGRLSSDSELVAMKASGISLTRLALPVVGFSTLVVALSIALNVEWVPWGERTFKQLLIKVGNTQVVTSIKEGTFTSGFFDLLLFADKVDSKTNHMSRVFIYDEREAKNPMTIVARTGELLPVKTENELSSAALLRLYNGSIHRNDLAGNTYQKIDFREYKLFLKLGEGSAALVTKPQNYSFTELRELIAQNPPDTFHGREFRGEMNRRFAMAFAPLIFVFLGIGFGTVRTRAVRAGAALIAMLTLLVYWSIQSYATIQVQRGNLPPWLAMELANATIATAGFIAFRRASW